MQTTSKEAVFDEYEAREYDERLYQYDNVATGVDSLDSIDDEHVDYYKENGFLAVQNAFTHDEIQLAVDGLMDVIDGKYPEFEHIHFEKSQSDVLDTLSPQQRRDAVRKLWRFVEYEPRLGAMASHEKLLSAVSRLVGSKTELFANQALIKPPKIGREKPWHQDHAFFDLPTGTPIVGCWIALDRAVAENGCMHVKPGTHNEGPKLHFKRRDFQICDAHLDLTRDVTVPLNPGGLLFFDGLMHHGTPANRSSMRRRALQFHYIPEGTPRITQDERLAVFGSEGKNVVC